MLLDNGDLLSGLMRLREPGSVGRCHVWAGELGEIDSDRDRFREIHRWAKRQRFVRGFRELVRSAVAEETILRKPGTTRTFV